MNSQGWTCFRHHCPSDLFLDILRAKVEVYSLPFRPSNHKSRVIFFISSLFLHITVFLFSGSFVIGWEKLLPTCIMQLCFDFSQLLRSKSFSIHETIKPSLFLCFELRIWNHVLAIPMDWCKSWSYIVMVDCCFSCWKAFVWV